MATTQTDIVESEGENSALNENTIENNECDLLDLENLHINETDLEESSFADLVHIILDKGSDDSVEGSFKSQKEEEGIPNKTDKEQQGNPVENDCNAGETGDSVKIKGSGLGSVIDSTKISDNDLQPVIDSSHISGSDLQPVTDSTQINDSGLQSVIRSEDILEDIASVINADCSFTVGKDVNHNLYENPINIPGLSKDERYEACTDDESENLKDKSPNSHLSTLNHESDVIVVSEAGENDESDSDLQVDGAEFEDIVSEMYVLEYNENQINSWEDLQDEDSELTEHGQRGRPKRTPPKRPTAPCKIEPKTSECGNQPPYTCTQSSSQLMFGNPPAYIYPGALCQAKGIPSPGFGIVTQRFPVIVQNDPNSPAPIRLQICSPGGKPTASSQASDPKVLSAVEGQITSPQKGNTGIEKGVSSSPPEKMSLESIKETGAARPLERLDSCMPQSFSSVQLDGPPDTKSNPTFPVGEPRDFMSGVIGSVTPQSTNLRPFRGMDMQSSVPEQISHNQYMMTGQHPQFQNRTQATTVPSFNLYAQRPILASGHEQMQSYQPLMSSRRIDEFQMTRNNHTSMVQNSPDSSYPCVGMQATHPVNLTNNQYKIQGPPGSFALQGSSSSSLRDGHYSLNRPALNVPEQRASHHIGSQSMQMNQPPSTLSQQLIMESSHPGQKRVATQSYSMSSPKAPEQRHRAPGYNHAHRGSARMRKLKELVEHQKSQNPRSAADQTRKVHTNTAQSVSSSVSERHSSGKSEHFSDMIVLSPPIETVNREATNSPLHPNFKDEQLYAMNFSHVTAVGASALPESQVQQRHLGPNRPASRSKKGIDISLPIERRSSRVISWISNEKFIGDLDSGTFDPSDNSLLPNPSLPLVAQGHSVSSDRHQGGRVPEQPTEIMGISGQPMIVVPQFDPPKPKKDKIKDKRKTNTRNSNGASVLPSTPSCSTDTNITNLRNSHASPGADQLMTTGSNQFSNGGSSNFSFEELEKNSGDSIDKNLLEILNNMHQKPKFSDEKAQADFEIQELLHQKSIEKFLANHSSSSDSGQKLPSLEQFLSSEEWLNVLGGRTESKENEASSCLNSANNMCSSQSGFKQLSFDPKKYITEAEAASLEKKKNQEGQTSLDNYLVRATHSSFGETKPQANLPQPPLKDLEDVIVQPMSSNPQTEQDFRNVFPRKGPATEAGRENTKRSGLSMSLAGTDQENFPKLRPLGISGSDINKPLQALGDGEMTRKHGNKKDQFRSSNETLQGTSHSNMPYEMMAQPQIQPTSSYQGLFHVPNNLHVQQAHVNPETFLTTAAVTNSSDTDLSLLQNFGSDIEMQQSSFEHCPNIGLENLLSENPTGSQFNHSPADISMMQLQQQNLTMLSQMTPLSTCSPSTATSVAQFKKPHGISISQPITQQNYHLTSDYMSSQPSIGPDSDVSMYSENSLRSNPMSCEKVDMDPKTQHSPYHHAFSSSNGLRGSQAPKNLLVNHQTSHGMPAMAHQNTQQPSNPQSPMAARVCSCQTTGGQKPYIFTSPAAQVQQSPSTTLASSPSDFQQSSLTPEQVNLLCQKYPQLVSLVKQQHSPPSQAAQANTSQKAHIRPSGHQVSQSPNMTRQLLPQMKSRSQFHHQTSEGSRRPDYTGNIRAPDRRKLLSSTDSDLQSYLRGGFPSLGPYDFDEESSVLTPRCINNSEGELHQLWEEKDASDAGKKDEDPEAAPFVIEESSLGSDENIFEPDADGETLLHLLCDMPGDRPKTLCALPGFHQALNLLNRSQETALFIAVKSNNLEVVKILVSQGADVNINCISSAKPFRAEMVHQTALHEAVEMGSLDIVRALLKSPNADVDSGRRGSGMTPLMLALERHSHSNRRQIIMTLIQNKASLTVKDKIQGRTPIMYAIQSRDVSLVEDILQMVGAEKARSLVTASAKKGMTCLHFAAELRLSSGEKQKLLRSIIVAGGDASVKNSEGETAKDWAKNDINEVLQNLAKLSNP